MLYQSGRRNKVYLATWQQAASVTNYWLGQLIRHRLIIIDMQVRTALDCCKDFRNLLTRTLFEIEENESILFQRFLLQH